MKKFTMTSTGILMGLAAVVILHTAFFLPGKSADFLSDSSNKDKIHSSETPNNWPGLEFLFASSSLPETPSQETKQGWVSQFYEIELKGTVAGNMAVLIDTEEGQELVVREGESINNATVKLIGRNTITLSGDSGRETLRLPAGSSSPAPKNSRILVIDRSELTKMVKNVNLLNSIIGLQPVQLATGKFGGYRIVRLKPLSLLARMGLRKHDIIKTVNGQKIRSPEDVYRVFEETVHGTHFKIDIRRHQSDVQLSYQIR